MTSQSYRAPYTGPPVAVPRHSIGDLHKLEENQYIILNETGGPASFQVYYDVYCAWR